MIIVELIRNLSLLIALSIVSGFIDKRFPRTTLKGLIAQGLLFGIVAIVGMMQPLIFSEGLIFDGRSIVISLSSLFFGPVSGSIAGMMAIIFRIIQGGSGIVPGTLVVISAMIIGSIFYFHKKKRNNEITVHQLLYLGISVHIVMLLMMFSLPFSTAISVVQQIGISVILSYPLATVLIGKILIDQEIHFGVIENIKASEFKFRMLADFTYDWEYWENEDQKLVYMSPSCERITGFTQDEFFSNPSLIGKIIHPEDSEYFTKHKEKVYSHEYMDVSNKLEFRIVKKDRSTVKIGHICRPIFDSNNKFLGRRVSNRDITDHKIAEEALRESEERFRKLYENAKIGLYRTLPNGTILMANKSLVKMLGYPSFEMLAVRNLEKGGFEPSFQRKEFLDKIEKDGEVNNFESAWIRLDGGVFFVSESAHAIRDSNDTILYYDGVVEDITERKRAEKELIDAKEKAEQSDKLKTEFLNQMSHEIRSPMNAVVSFANLLREDLEGKISPELTEYINGIDSAGKRLIRTVDLILNVSEMQVGTYEPSFGKFDLLKEIIVKIKNESMMVIESKGLKFNFYSILSEAVIFGDQYSIHQIILNLIDNAIKYTKKGYISVSVFKNERGINVSIEDTGIGMSEEFIEMMYHPFMQEERGNSRRYDGSGLGLSLVKKYCELNGITIEVESKKGIGSKFTLIFTSTK